MERFRGIGTQRDGQGHKPSHELKGASHDGQDERESGITRRPLILENNGDGKFAAPVQIPTAAKPSFVRALDWDGDGAPDLLLADYVGDRVLVLYNRGAAAFEEGESITLSPWWARLPFP